MLHIGICQITYIDNTTMLSFLQYQGFQGCYYS